MTTQNATVAPPNTTAARRCSEPLNTLVDQQTKAYILGLAVIEAEAAGYDKPKSAGHTRALLDEAIAVRYRKDPEAYARAVLRGQQELAEQRADAA